MNIKKRSMNGLIDFMRKWYKPEMKQNNTESLKYKGNFNNKA